MSPNGYLSNVNIMETITLDIQKFKEILQYSWHLLPRDKQTELEMAGLERPRGRSNHSF